MTEAQTLEAAWADARLAHPRFDVPFSRYRAFVCARLDDSVPAGEIAHDLYLASACAAGDEAALQVFDEAFMSQVRSFVGRIDVGVVDEVRQLVRERLFVSHAGKPPKITEYGGRGRLMSWLRVVAIRTALNLKGGRREVSMDAWAEDALLVEQDPELDYLRARYHEEFREAFVGALEGLEARERTLLRLNLVDGLNIDGIGQMYGVHRATVARWIADARESLFARTRDALHRQLGLSETEFASLVRLVRSQLDVSICRILSEGESP